MGWQRYWRSTNGTESAVTLALSSRLVYEKMWIILRVNNSLMSSTERVDVAWLWKKVILMCPNDCLPNVNPCVLELPRSFLFLQPHSLPFPPIFDCDMLAIFSAKLKGHIIGCLASYLFFFHEQENNSGHYSLPIKTANYPFLISINHLQLFWRC